MRDLAVFTLVLALCAGLGLAGGSKMIGGLATVSKVESPLVTCRLRVNIMEGHPDGFAMIGKWIVREPTCAVIRGRTGYVAGKNWDLRGYTLIAIEDGPAKRVWSYLTYDEAELEEFCRNPDLTGFTEWEVIDGGIIVGEWEAHH